MSTQATGMYAVIKDWSIYATDMQIMHERLSGNNEKKALDMRREMAQSVVDTYANDGDDNTNITLEQAMGYVDAQYKILTGQSIVDTIGQTTAGADSFWNKVPIVSLFIDNTTAEDLYSYMDGDDEKTTEQKANDVADCTSKGTLIGAGAGAAAGLKFGAMIGSVFGPAGTAAGAGVGAIIGALLGTAGGFIYGLATKTK